MAFTRKRTKIRIAAKSLFACLIVLAWSNQVLADTPEAVVTFHSASLYWTPDTGGSESREVRVRFRKSGVSQWRAGLSLPYNPIEGTELEKGAYRGSLVQLEPGTEYQVELDLEGTDVKETVTFRTWDETFPEGEVIEPVPGNGPIIIDESGTEDAYRVYDGRGQIFDANDGFRVNIDVRANYIIIRNFVLRDASEHGVMIREGLHDVVIENSDISGWGELEPGSETVGKANDAGVFVHRDTHRITIQRNAIHHPRYDSNTWEEDHCRGSSCSKHPYGPAAITLFHSAGNNVIRYNEIFSEVDHYFADAIIGGANSAFDGFPPDTDFYGNYFANAWDDIMQIEGGVRNVRVWNNFFEHGYVMIANAPVRIGPLYVFRNVFGISEKEPGSPGLALMKMGTANTGSDDQGREHMTGYTYLFHNTMSNPNGQGPWGLGARTRFMRKVVSRNNILFVGDHASHAIAISQHHQDVDFDYDLYNGIVPEGSQRNGIEGEPNFEVGTFDGDTRTADFRLAASSLGVDSGEAIPNFSDAFKGEAPDIGAHEGDDVTVYGIAAVEKVPGGCDNGLCGERCSEPCEPVSTACEGSPKEVSKTSLTVDENVAFEPIIVAAGDADARVTFSWDSESIFVRAEVADSDIRTSVNAETGDAWRDDSIELFFDPDESRGMFSENDLQIAVNASGTVFANREVDPQVSTSIDGTLNDDSPDQGYVIEIALRWEQLDLSPEIGTTIGADVALNDRRRPDDGTPTGGTMNTADWAELSSYRNPNSWCALRLVSQSTNPDDMDPEPEPDSNTPPDANPDDANDSEKEPGTTGGGCSVTGNESAGALVLLLMAFFLRRRTYGFSRF